MGGIQWETSLALIQIIIMGVVLILPIENLFNCHYLGKVESEINTLTYNEAQPNFFFDHYNLNPIEEIENQLKTMNTKNPFHINLKENAKSNDLIEFERNKMVNGNIFLKAMYK